MKLSDIKKEVDQLVAEVGGGKEMTLRTGIAVGAVTYVPMRPQLDLLVVDEDTAVLLKSRGWFTRELGKGLFEARLLMTDKQRDELHGKKAPYTVGGGK